MKDKDDQLTSFLSPRWVLGVYCFWAIGLSGCDRISQVLSSLFDQTVGLAGSDSTRAGTVVSFLRDRRDGHEGERFWRRTAPPYPRMPGPVPVNPQDWKPVLSKEGTTKELFTNNDAEWALMRWRIDSRTTEGLTSEKLWDFCLILTVEGFRIVSAWEANDDNQKECKESPNWMQFLRLQHNPNL